MVNTVHVTSKELNSTDLSSMTYLGYDIFVRSLVDVLGKITAHRALYDNDKNFELAVLRV